MGMPRTEEKEGWQLWQRVGSEDGAHQQLAAACGWPEMVGCLGGRREIHGGGGVKLSQLAVKLV